MDGYSLIGLIEEAKETIKGHEGFSSKPYPDPSGEGICIWYGFNLDKIPTQLQRDMADSALEVMVERIILDLEKALLKLSPPIDFALLPAGVQLALIDLCYNIGLNGILGFKRMLACIAGGDWAGTRVELLNSRYAQQLPTRAKNLANMIWNRDDRKPRTD